MACGSSGEKGANDPSEADAEGYVPTSKHYTPEQMGQLTLCTGYGDVLYHVLLRKKNGSTLEQELERHRQHPNPGGNDDMVEAIIQDVYKQPEAESFQVVDSFFGFCMEQLAAVPPAQQAVAQRCLRSTYISLDAYSLRANGTAEERVKEFFAPFDYSAPIVSRAFAFADPSVDYLKRADLMHEEWVRCFKEAEGA